MTDEQCQLLIDSIKKLTAAVLECSDKIATAIDDIPGVYTGEIEKKLQLLAEVTEEASYKGSSCKFERYE
jgi:hypothetical protein